MEDTGILHFHDWTVTTWLLVALACYLGFRRWRNYLATSAPFSQCSPRKWLFACVEKLTDTIFWLTLGIASVWAIQILLESIFPLMDEDRIKSIESWLWHFHEERLKRVTGITPMLILGSASFVLSMVRPQLRPATRFARFRLYLSRFGLVLTAITAFSFFWCKSVEHVELDWIAGRRSDEANDWSRVVKAKQELLALAKLDHELRWLRHDTFRDLGSFLDSTNGKPDADSRVEERAEVIVKSNDSEAIPEYARTANIDNSAPCTPQSINDVEQLLDETNRWFRTDQVQARGTRLARLKLARVQWEQRLSETQTAVAETLKTALGEFVPKDIDPLLQSLVKALTGVAVKTIVEESYPRDVHDLRSAARWLGLQRTPANGDQPVVDPDSPSHWHWISTIKPPEDKPVDGPIEFRQEVASSRRDATRRRLNALSRTALKHLIDMVQHIDERHQQNGNCLLGAKCDLRDQYDVEGLRDLARLGDLGELRGLDELRNPAGLRDLVDVAHSTPNFEVGASPVQLETIKSNPIEPSEDLRDEVRRANGSRSAR